MSKAIKFKNNMYLDTRGAVHNRTILKTYLDNEKIRVDGKQDKLYDSGWRYPTMENGWSDSSTSRKVAYRRIGNVVYLTGALNSGNYRSNIFTLPVGFRSQPAYDCCIVRLGGTSWGYFFLNYEGQHNGRVVMENPNNQGTGLEVPLFGICWVTDDAIPT